ncbi:hydrogenase nickel incorporation protein HypB [Candidatus Accumulibacter phosphatis]|jgi:hydrogenase nickel incorporation protein HypB|uniref:Hydrogenase maturation factor HypB n=1 Tax=Candidatus Accumulibacter phosphatis TaxID=327160 RepID=A0ABX1TRJ3_9PROT|nr:hydrogenase nickel incorporation protein HypB [Candidatus Accumulibacter phosphatis]NMQ26862.1 hydrogenase nickel incorporation protein HypB [Candidatus Accumulibacter phosphatis]
MCTTCGCGTGETRVAGRVVPGQEEVQQAARGHAPPRSTALGGGGAQRRMSYVALAADGEHRAPAHGSTGHAHHDAHPHGHLRADEEVAAEARTASRMVQIERDILAKNNAYATQNRRRFDDQGIFALNLVSSPGSGKTSLLCRTIAALHAKRSKLPIAVIEGDQQSSHDAERIRASGAPAVQINTGKGCHLDAHMVGHAVDELAPADDSLLLIENVGNLVCPAAFDLGEAHKVVILSVTEGEDKPLKYSGMFAAASLMLLNKIDLLPHVSFSVERAIAYARQINPQLQVIEVSATTGEGLEQWLAWLIAGCTARQEKKQGTMAALRRRIVELEVQAAAAAGG